MEKLTECEITVADPKKKHRGSICRKGKGKPLPDDGTLHADWMLIRVINQADEPSFNSVKGMKRTEKFHLVGSFKCLSMVGVEYHRLSWLGPKRLLK